MDDNTTPERNARMPGMLRVVLFVSLAFNLLVVGVVAGVVWNGGPPGGPPRHVRDVVAPYTSALDREVRRDIGRRIFGGKPSKDARETLRAEIRADYAEALSILRSDPFDAKAFEDVLTRQNKRAAQRQQRGQAELVAHIASMDTDARREYADRVSDALKRFGRKSR